MSALDPTTIGSTANVFLSAVCGLETLGLVEGGIPRMEQKVRRMIDVDQYDVEAAARRVRVEARAGFR
jgi:hypothetical protein